MIALFVEKRETSGANQSPYKLSGK